MHLMDMVSMSGQPLSTLLLLLLVLSLQALASTSPRIFIYTLPPELEQQAFREKCYGDTLLKNLRASTFYEPDPSKAEYFWIPGGGRYHGKKIVLDMVNYVRTSHPWWNMTVAAGQARHIMVTTSDNGAGEAFGFPNLKTGGPPDVNPASPTRNIIYLMFNGMQDGAAIGRDNCAVCFQPGKDIMIPSPQGTCGPLCGYSLQTLRNKSIWAKPREIMEAQLTQKRKHTMFFGGSIDNPRHDDFTGRGGAYVYMGNSSKYHIARSGVSPKISFPDAMLSSEFNYSPLGGHGGDTDRYVPGMLFGAIPILLNTSHGQGGFRVPQALPLEEVLMWHEFGTIADVYNLKDLGRQLECLMPRVVKMRARLQSVWPSFLYSKIHGSYLNETGVDDAFSTLMRVLGSRVPHGYVPAKETMKRLAHPGWLFPCRPDSPK